MLLVWVVAGALTWFGASICAELTSAYPRTGRRLRLPARDVFAGRRISLGLGDVLEHALRDHRGHRDGVRPLRVHDRPAGRPRHPPDRRSAPSLALSAINYFGVRPGSARADRARPSPRSAPSWCCVVLPFWHRHAADAGVAGGTVIQPRWIPSRAGGRALRVRRLAHGDLRRGGDARIPSARFRAR